MPRRVDATQALIVEALRKAGASVADTHAVGRGLPDLFVGYCGVLCIAMEVKSADGTLTPAERDWRETWRGPYAIVRTPEEAIEALQLWLEMVNE